MMKNIIFSLLVVYPALPSAEEGPLARKCQTELDALNREHRDTLRQYNQYCSENRSSARCIELQSQINSLTQGISDKRGECRRAAELDAANREEKDAKSRVDKQNDKTDMLSLLNTAVGTGLLIKGLSCCGRGCGAGCPLIPIGLAGILQGALLGKNSDKLSKTSEGLDILPTDCTGPHCAPAPPAADGDPPPKGAPGTLGSDLLAGGPTLPDLTNCDPFCPCPGDPSKLPPNCKITKDKDGNPKVTHGKDSDKDGFGDEEITAADAAKINANKPGIQKAINQAKAPYADMFSELEDKLSGEEGESEAANLAGEAFLSGGGSVKSAAGGKKPGKASKRRPTGEDDTKAIQNLMAQFMKKKKEGKGALKGASKLFGNSQIGVSQDNIFLMLHRRYQERREKGWFIESKAEPYGAKAQNRSNSL